jgi:hypothetical protein
VVLFTAQIVSVDSWIPASLLDLSDLVGFGGGVKPSPFSFLFLFLV